MLRHCRKERPVWPWLDVMLLGVLWGSGGLQGRGRAMVQVPAVVMQDPSEARGHHMGAQSVSGQVTSPAATSHRTRGGFSEPQATGRTQTRAQPSCATAQPRPHMCGEGALCRAPMALGGLP